MMKITKDFFLFFHKFSYVNLFFLSIIFYILFQADLNQGNGVYFKSISIFIFSSVSIFFLISDKKKIKKTIIFNIIFLIISYLLFIISVNIIDLSPDGRSAHRLVNFLLINGYNPFKEICSANYKNLDFLSSNIPISTYAAQFASHNIYFLENIFVIFSGNIDSSKTLKYIIFISSLYPAWQIVNFYLKKKNKLIKFTFFHLIIFNPIIFTSFFETYKDFYGYYLIVNFFYYFLFLFFSEKKNFKIDYIYLLISLCLLGTVKLNFFFYSLIFLSLSFLLHLKFKKEKLILKYYILTFFSILFIFGFTPGTKNYIGYHSLIYDDNEYIKIKPICFDRREVNTGSFDTDLRKKYSPELFLHSLFLKASKHHLETYPTILWKDIHKVSLRDYYYHFANVIPFFGSAGPLFGLSMIISIIYFIFGAIFYKFSFIKTFPIIIILFSVLIFPFPNFMRFVPHVWLALILISMLCFSYFKSYKIILILIILNSLSVLYVNISGMINNQIYFKKSLNIFFNLTENEKKEIWISNHGLQLVTYLENFEKFNLSNLKIVSRDKIKNCNVQFRPHLIEGIFCLDNHKKLNQISEDIISLRKNYPKLFPIFSSLNDKFKSVVYSEGLGNLILFK